MYRCVYAAPNSHQFLGEKLINNLVYGAFLEHQIIFYLDANSLSSEKYSYKLTFKCFYSQRNNSICLKKFKTLMNVEKIDRKISVIFATDVVDYSLHMEKVGDRNGNKF